jgi:hypothetical protein
MSRLRAAIISALCLLAGSCLDQRRLNAHCQWVGDTSTVAIDMRDPSQRAHLAMDVRIAGENAVRYGDSAKVRKVGLEAASRIGFACRDSLYAVIMRQHHVNRNDIHVAARTRNFWIDAALVYVPIGLLFYVIASRMTGRILRRGPPSDERWIMWVHLAWVGVAGSAIATAVAHFHAWNVDWVRLRNGHLSFRAGYLPTALYAWRAYAGALAIFTIAAWRQLRVARVHHAAEPVSHDANRWRA